MPPSLISESEKPIGFEIVGCLTAEYNGWTYWWRSAKRQDGNLIRSQGWHRMHITDKLW